MIASAPEAKPVAAVITEWRKWSHADVILSRLLDPAAWGHNKPFNIKLVSLYADQFPENDLSRRYCGKYGVPIFPTVTEAVGVGTRAVAVEGVLIIGEHGQYAGNARGQKFYPRRRLFEAVIHAFRMLGRRVPVFSDKHLSYDWLSARWMYDLARHEGVPFMAGSSIPVAWRVPELNLPIGCAIAEALGLGYADLDAYGFHALEGLQCMVECRRGGETGIESVQCLSGGAVWDGAESGIWSRSLLDALDPVRARVTPHVGRVTRRPDDTLFVLKYCDGLKACVCMLDSVGECFAFSGRRKGVAAPDACVFDLENGEPFGHFGHLVRAIEQTVLTGTPAYPVERTLLTTGVLEAALQSRAQGGVLIRTPHLTAIGYQPADWPFAKGPRGTAA